jgi:hypothetical protein
MGHSPLDFRYLMEHNGRDVKEAIGQLQQWATEPFAVTTHQDVVRLIHQKHKEGRIVLKETQKERDAYNEKSIDGTRAMLTLPAEDEDLKNEHEVYIKQGLMGILNNPVFRSISPKPCITSRFSFVTIHGKSRVSICL